MIVALLLYAVVIAALAGCAPPPDAAIATLPSPSATPSTEPASSTECSPPPVVVPTQPANTPGYAELDETTGLHVTGRARAIDPETYRLEIAGLVGNPLSLSYDELRCLPRLSDSPVLVCPGFFEDQAEWTGASLADILDLAGIQEGASRVRLIGADRYETVVTLEDALSTRAFLAYEWEGEPLPILHGFPVRAVFPTLGGSRWVKWIVKIEVS